MKKIVCPKCESYIIRNDSEIYCTNCSLEAFYPLIGEIPIMISRLNEINEQLIFSQVDYDLLIEKTQILRSLLRYDDLVNTYELLFHHFSEEVALHFGEIFEGIMQLFNEIFISTNLCEILTEKLSFESMIKLLILKAKCFELLSFNYFLPFKGNIIEDLNISSNFYKGSNERKVLRELGLLPKNEKISKFEIGFEKEIILCNKCLIQIDDNKNEYLWEIAKNYSNLGEYDNSLYHYNQITNMDGLEETDLDLWKRKAMNYKNLGETSKFIRCCSQIVTLTDIDEDEISSFYEFVGLMDDEKTFEMLKEVNDSYRFFKAALDVAYNQGIKFFEKINYSNALDQFNKCLDLEDNLLDIDMFLPLYFKAITLVKMGRHKEALNYWDKLLQMDETFATAWAYKTLCIINTEGPNDFSKECLKTAIFFEPENDIANNISKNFKLLYKH